MGVNRDRASVQARIEGNVTLKDKHARARIEACTDGGALGLGKAEREFFRRAGRAGLLIEDQAGGLDVHGGRIRVGSGAGSRGIGASRSYKIDLDRAVGVD